MQTITRLTRYLLINFGTVIALIDDWLIDRLNTVKRWVNHVFGMFSQLSPSLHSNYRYPYKKLTSFAALLIFLIILNN